jgi:Ketopantoate reductase PanE/ApbA
MSSLRALVVGAGAVGQAYGQHLRKGGAQVSFLVKPKHAEAARHGFTLYPQNRRKSARTEPETFSDFTVLSDVEAVTATRFDQVYLTMSSTGLRAGEDFARLARVIGDATLVLLQPGPEDRAFVLQHVRREQVVQGIITLIAYHGPLPGETRLPRPGVVYWFPPLAKSPLGGAHDRVAPVVRALAAGGLPAREASDAAENAAFGGPVLLALMAALEAAHWSFAELRRGPQLLRAERAAREALAIVAAHEGHSPPIPLRVLPLGLAVRALLPFAPALFPFDVEAYLKAHFTKVGDQTRDTFATLIRWGEGAGLPTSALRELMQPLAPPG